MLLVLSLACGATAAPETPLHDLVGGAGVAQDVTDLELLPPLEDSASPRPTEEAPPLAPETVGPTEEPPPAPPFPPVVVAPPVHQSHVEHVTHLHNRVIALDWFLADKASQKEGLTPQGWVMPLLEVYRADPRSHAPNAADIYSPEELASVPLPAPADDEQMYELYAEALGVVSPLP